MSLSPHLNFDDSRASDRSRRAVLLIAGAFAFLAALAAGLIWGLRITGHGPSLTNTGERGQLPRPAGESRPSPGAEPAPGQAAPATPPAR